MRISRRCLLASVATASVARAATPPETLTRGRIFPTIAVRYLDPATEFTLVRLTDPQFAAFLPPPRNRALAPRAMLYGSDFNGKWDAYRMDLKTGESRQLTDATALDPSSLGLLPGERGFWHFDGAVLTETLLTKLQGFKSREIYRTPSGYEKTPGISFSEDGQYAAFVEKTTEKPAAAIRYRLQIVRLAAGQASGHARTVLEASDEIADPLIRPKHASLYFRLGDHSNVINFDGTGGRRLSLAEGEIGQEQWIADGHALLYLNRPSDAKKLTAIREFSPESGEDAQIAGTSQYVRFHANPDASMFVGASGSVASPYVLLLARAAKREFTLAEHRASDTRMVAPVFTPNSQAILFMSDRHGKPAIYWMSVDKLVSATDGSA